MNFFLLFPTNLDFFNYVKSLHILFNVSLFLGNMNESYECILS